MKLRVKQTKPFSRLVATHQTTNSIAFPLQILAVFLCSFILNSGMY